MTRMKRSKRRRMFSFSVEHFIVVLEKVLVIFYIYLNDYYSLRFLFAFLRFSTIEKKWRS